MKYSLNRVFSFIKTKISIILFISLIFTFLLPMNVCKSIKQCFIADYTVTKSIKTHNFILRDNELQDINMINLIDTCKFYKLNANTYKDRVENQEKNIDIYNMNPHSKSNLTVDEINVMLIGTGLELQGRAFKDMEDKYNVNALFAIAVAMHESANGYKTANSYNYFGFRGNNGWMSFSSEYDCIQYFGKLINKYYLNRTTIQSIQNKYCPNSSSWTQLVISHMNQLKEKL